MPLETTMLCVDNSEWMRNGDFSPSRMEAVQDAANLVSNAKMQSNAENTVGVMALAGRNPELLVSPTDDMGKIMSSIHEIKLFGRLNFADGVQVAYLALKHRRNKNGGQRIVVFVGSPVDDDPAVLKKVAGNLKKNGVAVDVISVGEVETNQAKLEDFVKRVDSNGNSNLVSIPTGCVPSDVLVTSPVINEGHGSGGFEASGGFGAAAAPAGGNAFGFGVDPNLDPELAMVLRVSMEEERARQEQEATRSDGAPPEPLAPAALIATPTAPIVSTPSATEEGRADADDDELLLQQALALSMHGGESGGESSGPSVSAEAEVAPDGLDEEMQLALQMSMQVDSASPAEPAPSQASSAVPSAPPAAPVYDPSFVNSLLASLPGVDPSDPRIQQALAQLQRGGKRVSWDVILNNVLIATHTHNNNQIPAKLRKRRSEFSSRLKGSNELRRCTSITSKSSRRGRRFSCASSERDGRRK